MDLIYPSASFPPPPSLRMTVPDGWQPLPMPDAVVAAADPDSPAGFRVTLLVVTTRVVRTDAGLDQLVASAHARTAAQFPSTTTKGSERAEIAGHDAVVTARTIATDRTPSLLFQAEAMLLVPTAHPDVRDLVQITGTCPADVADRYGAIFRAAMQSLLLSV